MPSMSVFFTTIIRLICYKAVGESIHRLGQKILSSPSFDIMKTEMNATQIQQMIEQKEYRSDDLLIILWLLFVDTIENLLAGDWGKSYSQVSRKDRFVLERASRNRLYKEIIETDKFMRKRFLARNWSMGIKESQGIFDFIGDCIKS